MTTHSQALSCPFRPLLPEFNDIVIIIWHVAVDAHQDGLAVLLAS